MEANTEKLNIVETFLDGEVNALSASSNQIGNVKSKERKEISIVSNLEETPKRYMLVLLSGTKSCKSNTRNFLCSRVNG